MTGLTCRPIQNSILNLVCFLQLFYLSAPSGRVIQFQFLGHAREKSAKSRSKICDFSKLAINSPKSYKSTIQMCNSPFWADVCIIKWSPFFFLSAPEVQFFALENGHFWQKFPVSSAKKRLSSKLGFLLRFTPFFGNQH